VEPAVRNYFLTPVFKPKSAKMQQKTDFLGRFFVVTLCGPDGLHSHSYNTIQVIPPGLSLDEAFAMVKKLQNAKENIPEESS
jgi:hypothetical protein